MAKYYNPCITTLDLVDILRFEDFPLMLSIKNSDKCS